MRANIRWVARAWSQGKWNEQLLVRPAVWARRYFTDKSHIRASTTSAILANPDGKVSQISGRTRISVKLRHRYQKKHQITSTEAVDKHNANKQLV